VTFANNYSSILNNKTISQSRFKILKGLPPYGKMYVPFPDGNWSEGLAVEFIKDDGTKWVANIKHGDTQFSYINELNDPTEVLIISNGYCYIIDRNRETSIIDFGYDFKQIIEYNHKFILVGTRNIAIVEDSKTIARYKNLCFDFIEDIKIQNGILSGVLNDYNAWDRNNKTDFDINLDTYEYSKSKTTIKSRPKNKLKTVQSKRWWEIWK
jgi:hypothetical protein